MNVVGRVGSLISQGVYSVATPFHPFGGAVDIIVVQQEDGSFRSTPWYVRFGKFQGVLKGAEKIVKIHVNGEEATFHMYLENTGEAFFLKDDPSNLAENVGGEEEEAEEESSLGNDNNHEVSIEKMTICVTKECAAASELQGVESDSEQRFYELKEDPSSSSSSAYGSSRFDNLEDIIESQPSNPDVIVVVSGYGQILTAPISSEEEGERPCDEEDTRNAIGVEPVEARSAKEETPETLTLNDDAPPGRRWRLWPIQFRKAKSSLSDNSGGGGGNASNNEELFADSESTLRGPPSGDGVGVVSPRKTYRPSSDQMSSLNLAEGRNTIAFGFSTRVLGTQQVDAHVYLWKWNTRIVISDVDGTITRSDVLGQFMPLVGRDWTQSGVARLFSAIKVCVFVCERDGMMCSLQENGYQLLFLSARAIVQAYLTRNFLVNLKQDGKALPNGPVVISPDGLFPSLYREVIRRAPHEFKIACLEDIRALFPTDYNPFYAGFGNRDTDELSYRKMGIPKGKIFIINPKGEVAINHRVDVKSYTSLHTLVNDMFPLTSLVEQEDFNSWNFWKMPVPGMDF